MTEPVQPISDEDIERVWSTLEYCASCAPLSVRDKPRCLGCDMAFARAILRLAAERVEAAIHHAEGKSTNDYGLPLAERDALIRRVLTGGER